MGKLFRILVAYWWIDSSSLVRQHAEEQHVLCSASLNYRLPNDVA